MSNQNRNRPYPRVQEEANIIKAAHQGAHTGALVGGATAAGTASLFLKKKRLLGIAGSGALGAVTGAAAGRRIGIDRGAKDVRDARKALNQQRQLEQITRTLDFMEARAEHLGFESIDGATAAKPVSAIQRRPVARPSVRGMRSEPGNGVSAEALFAEARQDIASRWGWGIASSLADDELTDEHAEALHNVIMGKIQKADAPAAGLRSGEDFERALLAQHMGARVVEAMGPAEVHAHYLGAVRKGLVELDNHDETTDFTLINRTRNGEGEFAPEGQVTSQSIQRAYASNPRERTTGKTASTVGAVGAAAGLAGAIAHLRGRKGKRPRLTGGSVPQLGFAAKDDGSHPVRDTLAGVGAGALGAAALLALRKRRQLRLPTGVPKLPPKTIDVETETMSRRIPFLTSFVMGHPGAYPIKRRALRGKKPPTGIHPRQLGKKKPTNLAFLIHDPDFPILPMKQPKLPPGMHQRVKPARTRKEVLERLKAITALSSREFGTGNLVGSLAGDAIDAVVGGSLAGETPAQRRQRQARLAQQQQNVSDDSDIANDSTAQPRTLDSALDRLANMDFAIGDAITRGAARLSPEIAAIGIGDVLGETAHDKIKAAQDKKKRRLTRQRGGVEPLPGMGTSPGVQTSMSAVHDTLLEFDHGNERTARAKRNGTTVAAAGAGGIAGAVGGLKYDQGSPVAHSDLKPGDRVYRRFGPGGLFQHAGIVGQDGKITHRTSGSATYRAIKPDSFAKTGKAPTYRENNPADVSRAKAAKNASKAAGTRAGKYCVGSNNCQTAVERIASKGRPVSGQLRRAGIGAAIGAAGVGSVAAILNRKIRKDK